MTDEQRVADAEARLDQGVLVYEGEVIDFDTNTGIGTVRDKAFGTFMSFKSVDFSSGRPARFPIVGEIVDLVFSQGHLVSVRSVREEQ